MNILSEDMPDLAFVQGWDAYEYAKSLEDNPYDPKDNNYNLWRQGYLEAYRDWETDRKSTRLNSSHLKLSRMPSSA